MINLSFPTVKLGNHIRKVSLKVKDSEYDASDITVFGVTNAEGITITGQKVSDNIGNYILLQDNQFAYNPYRINVGSLGLFEGDDIGAVSPAYVVFETLETYDSHFLLFYLKSSLGIKLIKWYGDRGGVRAALRYDDLCKIDVPDIPVNKQRLLMQNFSLVNQRLAEYNHQNVKQSRYIARLRQSILQQAIEGKLCEQDTDDEPASELLKRIKAEMDRLIKEGKIKKEKQSLPIKEEEKLFDLPNGWEWCRFCKIINIASNLVDSEKYSELLHIAPDNIEKGTGRLLKCNTIYEDHVISKNHHFSKDQLIYSKIRPALRKVIIAPFDGLCSADMYPLDVYVNRYYIFWYMLTDSFTEQVTRSDNRVKMPKTNQDELSKTVIPLPPLNEQGRIVEKINKLMAYCDELEKQVNESRTYAEKLIQSVLVKAFNAESRKKSVVGIITIAPQIQSQSVKLAARGSISEETMKHIEQTIDDMCGD